MISSASSAASFSAAASSASAACSRVHSLRTRHSAVSAEMSTSAPAVVEAPAPEPEVEAEPVEHEPHIEPGLREVVEHGVRQSVEQEDHDAPAAVGRQLAADNPGADTLWLAWPHRPTVDVIEPLERALGINVMSSAQAIIWESLRRCGIFEPIHGFGRLLAEPR